MHDADLGRLRREMDALNDRLAAVLHERARLVRKIGAWKRTHGKSAIDEAREAAMLSHVLREPPADGYSADELRGIFVAVFAASRRLVTNPD